MSAPIPSDAQKFRTGILPSMIFIFVGGIAVGYPFAFFLILTDHEFAVNWQDILKFILFSISIIFPAALLFSFVFASVMSVSFPTYISVHGIHGHSFWGKRRFIGWNEIAEAKKFTMFNLKYVHLYPVASRKFLSLPLFQSSQAEFLSEIAKFAPPDSPIRNHLRPINT